MQKLFVLGGNKIGKTTFSKKWSDFYIFQNKKSPLLYEAGSWCRNIHKERYGEKSYEEQMNPIFREQLYAITREHLSKDYLYSFKSYRKWERDNNFPQFQMLIGLRNIDDFNLMLEEDSSANYCVFLADETQMLDDYMLEMMRECSEKNIKYTLVNPYKIVDRENDLFKSISR